MATYNGNVVGGSLALRSSTNSGSRLATIPDGTALTVSTVSGNAEWFFTTYSGQTGYVMAEFIGITNGGGSCKVSTTSGSLNVRKSPSGDVIFSAAKDSILRLLDYTSTSGWYRVSNSNGTGWASSGYLTILTYPSGSGSSGSSTYPYPATVETSKHGDGGYLNLRETASTSADAVAEIPNGASIYVQSLSGEWLAAKYGNYTGYVMAKFIAEADAYGDDDSSDIPATGLFYAKVSTDSGPLKVRPSAGTSGTEIGFVPKNRIMLCENSGTAGWYKTHYDGQIGYVSSDYMTPLDQSVHNSYFDRMMYIYPPELDQTNGSYYDDASGAWCQKFVNWLLGASYMPFSRLPTTASTGEGIEFWVKNAQFYFKNATWKGPLNTRYSLGVGSSLTNAEQAYVPEPGDIIYLRWEDEEPQWYVSHTGIVYRVANNRVYILEGNATASGYVTDERSFALNNAIIIGYGKPNYS